MLKCTNGRESQAPVATLQWGPHGTIQPSEPKLSECWVSIDPVRIGDTWPPVPHVDSWKLQVEPTSAPSPAIECSPVTQPSWAPAICLEDRLAMREAAKSGSLLASLNVRTLTDAKLRTISEWMHEMGVMATAMQETCTEVGLLMPPPRPYSLFLGPCVNGTGPRGRPSKSRGCGWIVNTEWAAKAGAQFNDATDHSCTITIMTKQGEVDLVSIYSPPSEPLTAEEKDRADACSCGRRQIWFADSNADPRKAALKSEQWEALLTRAGGFKALNRLGKWGHVPTRYPGPNETSTPPGHLDIVATSPMLTEKLSAECVWVGGEQDPHFAADTDHRPVVVSVDVNQEWGQQPNNTYKWKWDLQKLTSNPALREEFEQEVKAPLTRWEGRWRHLSSGVVCQSQLDLAVEELQSILLTAAEEVVGKKRSRVRAVAKPWWSKALTAAEKARRTCFQQWKRGGRVPTSASKSRLDEAKRAYKTLIRKEKRDYFSTRLGKADEKGGPGRSRELHRIFRSAAQKHAAPANFLGHRATLSYVGPKVRCTNVKQVAEAVSLFTSQVSSGADRDESMDEGLRREVSASMPSIFSDTSGTPSPVTRRAIRVALKKLRKKLKKACGPDQITNWMIVWAGPAMLSALVPLFQAMWRCHLLPKGFGDATLRYIPKGTKPAQEISGYRPISLTSCIGKLYTLVWLPRLVSDLSPWIGRHQGAFQKGTGALEQSWLCMELIHEQVRKGGEAHVALTDLEKCYDNIWREGLYFILHSFGVRGDMLQNIRLWVESTVAFPVWNGVECPRVTPKEGLKQGCVLSPILCVAFMATLTCPEPDTPCHPHLRSLRKKLFSQGLQGMTGGIESELLGEQVPCLQFVDDCTLLAPSKARMVELFKRYENFCSKLRIPVNWGKCSVTVFREKPVQTKEQREAEKSAKAARVAELASLPREEAKAVRRAQARNAAKGTPPYLTTEGGVGVPQKEHCRVLGAHLCEHLETTGAQKHAASKVNSAVPVTRWAACNLGAPEALEYVRSTVMPAATYAAGVAGTNLAWVDTQWRRLLRAALGYEPGGGEFKLPPNLSLEEQSGQLPWSKEVRMVNTSLNARLASSGGPDTLPRKLMAGILEKGMVPRLALSAHEFRRRQRRKARTRAMNAHKGTIVTRRHKSRTAPPESGTKLYCELTPGKFPQVTSRGPQHHLERQGVGLVPLPRPGERECTRCGGRQSIAHTAFECPDLRAQREVAITRLDEACSEMGVRSDHPWWHLTDTQKLKATFCPTRGTVPPPVEGAFFSRASAVWKNFYEAAEEAMSPWEASQSPPH